MYMYNCVSYRLVSFGLTIVLCLESYASLVATGATYFVSNGLMRAVYAWGFLIFFEIVSMLYTSFICKLGLNLARLRNHNAMPKIKESAAWR